ncbi:unnamed protein product, partial [marine sediment metagenome]
MLKFEKRVGETKLFGWTFCPFGMSVNWNILVDDTRR